MNPREGVSATLGSARLTVFLLFVILGIFAVATIIPQDPTTAVPLEALYSPEAVYFLRLSGLADIFHSGWFIFVLLALAVNLVFGAVSRLPAILKAAERRFPPALNIDPILKGARGAGAPEGYLHAEIKSGIAREEFRETIQDWARPRLGKPRALRDEGGLNELQLGIQKGRFSRVAAYVAVVGLLLAIAGFVIDQQGEFQAEMTVEAGSSAHFLHVLRGKPQGRWKVLEENSRPQPGFFVPGFDVACTGIDIEKYRGGNTASSIRTHLDIYERGQKVDSQTVSPERPGWYRGLVFYQGEVTRGGKLGATLVAEDAETKSQTKLDHLTVGTSLDLGDYKIKLVDEQTMPDPNTLDTYGPSVQLEYQEGSAKPERFWIFRNFPDYDRAHRRKARVHFTLAGLSPEPSTTLRISREPGAPFVIAGMLVAFLGLAYSLLFGLNRYWFAWFPGRVVIVGWSHRRSLFEPKFERAVNQLKARVLRIDKYREKPKVPKVDGAADAPA